MANPLANPALLQFCLKVGDSDFSSDRKPPSKEDVEWLQAAMSEGLVESDVDVGNRLKSEILKFIGPLENSQSSEDDIETADRLRLALAELAELCLDLDVAEVVTKDPQFAGQILDLTESHTQFAVRGTAAQLIAACAANNAKGRRTFLAQDSIGRLTACLRSEVSDFARQKLLTALSAFTGPDSADDGGDGGVARFLSPEVGGGPTLAKLLRGELNAPPPQPPEPLTLSTRAKLTVFISRLLQQAPEAFGSMAREQGILEVFAAQALLPSEPHQSENLPLSIQSAKETIQTWSLRGLLCFAGQQRLPNDVRQLIARTDQLSGRDDDQKSLINQLKEKCQ